MKVVSDNDEDEEDEEDEDDENLNEDEEEDNEDDKNNAHLVFCHNRSLRDGVRRGVSVD